MLQIDMRGLEEILTRMQQYPQKLNASMRVTLQAVLLALHENVPSYPPPPPDSTYVRTGTLGRTLGADGGRPDIYEARDLGNEWQARFGTRLGYAPYVIGEKEQARHMAHWWKISTIAERAREKIDSLFMRLADRLAAFLEGKEGGA